jgi:hypothetical protein
MSNLSVNTITDASGGSTASINGLTPQASNMQPHNLIINGAMTVAQRGTSQTNSSYGSVDRWYIYSSGGTFTQETSSPPEGFSHYLTCTSATGSFIVSQAIELPATGKAGVFYNGQTITISYYAKSTVAGDALYNPISFRNGATSITNIVVVENDNTDTNILTTSWARYSKTYTIGVDAHINNTCLVIQPRTNGAPSGNISITGVQLEAGSTASSFAHENYADTLQKCLRYYNRIGGNGGQDYFIGGSNNSSGFFRYAFPVPMRAVPSFTNSGGFTVNNFATAGTPSVVQLDVASTKGMVFLCTGGVTYTSGNSILLYENSTNSGNYKIDAEL